MLRARRAGHILQHAAAGLQVDGVMGTRAIRVDENGPRRVAAALSRLPDVVR